MNKLIMFIFILYQFGDWGLGIGDWAQSPIPNPQSPKIMKLMYLINIINLIFKYY